MLKAVRVFAIAPIGWATRGLHIGNRPWFWPQGAQRGGGVEGTGADLHIVGLQDRAALVGPVILEPQDNILKGTGFTCKFGVHSGLGCVG